MSNLNTPAPHASSHAPRGSDELADGRALIRRQRLISAMGLITETCPRGAFATSSAGASGQLIGNPVYMFQGEVCTSIPMECAIVGAGETSFEVCFYSNDNVRRATSGDVKATMLSTGDKDVPMLAAFPIPADGIYWPMFIGVGGTTPAISRFAGGPGAGAGGGPYVGASIGIGLQQGALGAAPATMAPSASNVLYWMGIR